MSADNISSFLNSIKDLKKETVTVFLPSKASDVELTTLNLKQQKDIISCIADGVTGLVSFNRILNNIIESASGLKDLTIIDRAPAIIGLRIKAHGPSYKSEDKTVDLNTIINQLSDYNPVSEPETVLEYNGIQATVGIPTLSQESSVISKLEEEVKKNGEDNTKNLGSIYIYEIIKYVKSLEYNNITIDFGKLPIKERINVLESLPLSLNKLIINYIEGVKQKERELLTIDGVVVEISPGFFDVE